ncbi:MAG: hypothetical protein VW298_01880, partial [Candidatus Woesearchaeota archaeon]
MNPSQVLKSLGDLPPCNSETEGFLYYIENISQFRYCSSNGFYASIDLTGPRGPSGADGKDGTDNRAIYTVYCSGPFNAFGNTYGYDYSIVGLNSGDVIVTAEIAASDIQVSQTLYYSKFQNAAIPTSGRFGGINLTADIFQTNNFGYFRFSINPDSLVIKMEYYDSQLPSYGYSNPQILNLNITSSDCVVSNFD